MSEAWLSPGQTFGRYTLGEVLGHGTSGVVHLAIDGDREVAIKLLRPELAQERQFAGRVKREAAILDRLKSPHIVKFIEFLDEGEAFGLVMERVAGTSLEALLHDATVTSKFAEEVLRQVCRALAVAHEDNVVHRDLKPANIMVEELEGGAVHVRVLDFGLAKILYGGQMATGLTERDMIFGTPEYMAPEQCRGDDADARSDVYACGAILYEMLTGRVPIRAKTPFATMTAKLCETILPPREVAPHRSINLLLETITMRALSTDPSDRYPNAAAMLEALSSTSFRKVLSVHPTADDDLEARDTELALRQSQIQLMLSKAPGEVSEQEGSAAWAPEPLDGPTSSPASSWVAPTGESAGALPFRTSVVSFVVVAVGVIVGIILALR